MHYPGGQRVQYPQELGNADLIDQQEGQGHGKTVSQYEKGYQYGVGKAALDKHIENALLKSELYGDPGKSSATDNISLCVILKMCQQRQQCPYSFFNLGLRLIYVLMGTSSPPFLSLYGKKCLCYYYVHLKLLFYQLINCQETWYEHSASVHHPTLLLFNLLLYK